MRDLLLFAIIFGTIPFIFKRPAVGVIVFTWISLMNPHRLSYGAAYDFPFVALIAGVTTLAVLLTKQPKGFPRTPVTILLLVFTAWMTFTSFFALEPGLVWQEWNRVIKTMFMVFVSFMVLNTERDIKQYTWVVALSIGIYGLKGGLFVLASGGNFKVYGPDGSYIAENNAMALALVVTLPLIWYLRNQATNKLVSLFMLAMTIFTAIAAVGSYSRGALVGGGAMLGFLWLKSKNKAATGVAVIGMIALVSLVMPAQWFERMDTIGEYKEDGSAMGRINAWQFAINVATHNVLGGGFNVFSVRQFAIYAPNPLDYHVAHSIFFQVLGDHGVVGLTMFVVLMLCAWRTGTRVVKFCADAPELKWASDLAKMAQVCIIGYAVSGAFLSLAYFDLYYDIIIILVALEKLLLLKRDKAGQPIPYVPQAARVDIKRRKGLRGLLDHIL
ncbi:putative O-glycosylation ligase, exosortase A system-associated [Massilia sp. S19_KUP03_FR1]|uniref:putative O-glycosylation ligase, exosortase A system-associated n=1 Tax=Massilia sp. S19_KUP03_FR1 TaxID=3025503 RepID=UPI002FCDA5A4